MAALACRGNPKAVRNGACEARPCFLNARYYRNCSTAVLPTPIVSTVLVCVPYKIRADARCATYGYACRPSLANTVEKEMSLQATQLSRERGLHAHARTHTHHTHTHTHRHTDTDTDTDTDTQTRRHAHTHTHTHTRARARARARAATHNDLSGREALPALGRMRDAGRLQVAQAFTTRKASTAPRDRVR